jgi:anti-sigma regulatory factor (Ser/Thr protein kinase)
MVKTTIPAQIECLKDVFTFVRRGGQDSGLATEDLDKLELILEELFVNIARYAYAPGQGDVEVGYEIEARRRLLVEISDSGREFNPLASDPPDFSRGLAERPLGGMGIFLVKTIADSIQYQRDGEFNRLSFVFSGG